MSQHSRDESGDGIYKNQCRQFSAAQDVVADADFQRGEFVDHSFVDAFVVPGDQEQSLHVRQRLDGFLRGSPSLWREQNPLRAP